MTTYLAADELFSFCHHCQPFQQSETLQMVQFSGRIFWVYGRYSNHWNVGRIIDMLVWAPSLQNTFICPMASYVSFVSFAPNSQASPKEGINDPVNLNKSLVILSNLGAIYVGTI
jgi:hypothetical protein